MASPSEPAVLLECRGVSVRFGSVTALENVSFSVPERSIVGIIGPNGAGKTTLFNSISRLVAIDAGDILLRGRSLASTHVHQMPGLGVARTFQNVALFGTQTVLDNVLVGAHARMRGGFAAAALRFPLASAEAALRREAQQVLEALDLASVQHRCTAELPFGTRKRVELARALISRPALVMLDEPAAGLNHEEVDQLRTLVRELAQRFALTIILVEHHMQFVMSLSDRVVALAFGRKLTEGSPHEVQNHEDVKRAYLGGAA